MRKLSRPFLAVLVGIFTTFFAFPQMVVASDLFDTMLACAEVSDDSQRLNCYDKNAKSLKIANSEGQLHVVDKKEIREIERQSFGFANIQLPWFRGGTDDGASGEHSSGEKAKKKAKAAKVAPLKFLEVPLKSVRKNNRGMYVFTLENGQVWVQSEASRVFFKKNKKNIVKIKKGAMGSYRMSINGSPRAFYVKRLE